MLKITKKGDKYWLFEDSQIGLFSPSKFTINLELNEIVIVYENGLKSKRYNVSDCEIYDLGATSTFTTSNGDLFMQKLEELNCPCFQKNENIFNISGGAWGDITGNLSNQTDLKTALDSKQDKLTETNFGNFMDVDLATKLTPSPNDTILGRDGITGKAVEYKYPIAEGYFNGTNFYLESGFVNLIQATTARTYIDLATNLQYRWSGSAYVQIGVGNTQNYFTFSTNTTLSNSHHNAVIWVTATINITIPSGLRSDFNCTFRTLTGAIATFLTSGTTINAESDGDVQAAKTMSYLAQYTTNNYIISGGGLS